MRICEVMGCPWPVHGTDRITKIGYCKSHQWKRTDIDRRSIAAKSMSRAKSNPRKPGFSELPEKGGEMDGLGAIQAVSGGSELWRWFQERRLDMDGKCHNCMKPSNKNNDKYFHFSIAHLLPKQFFKSISTHESNWLELCPDCHNDMDNKMLDLTEMNCWDEIITKFCKLYPAIDASERRRIPSVLLQYIDTEK